MLIIPAIDLIEGKCVRLTEGAFESKKIYNDDPIEVAKIFKDMGAKRIHIIDLDGAKDGISKNREIIKKIKKNINIQIQTGGGIRTQSDVEELLDAGVDRLILGTILVENTPMVAEWREKYGPVFLAGIDVKNRNIQTKGWQKSENLNAIKFGKNIFNIGITGAIYTDISRDGKLIGPNIDDAKDFSNKTGLRIILSGGVSCKEDFETIKTLRWFGLSGTIVGKAYYENKINLKEIIEEYQENE